MVEKLSQSFDHIYSFFKRHAVISIKISLAVLVVVLCSLTSVLLYEYRFFKIQTEKMLELKEDYRNYVLAVKKILHDYNRTKVRLEELETLVVEKKKEFETLGIGLQATFPEGVRVYSTDDEQEEQEPFPLVNRELEYLKQSTLDYLKEQKLSYLTQRMGSDAWREYTDHIIERDKAAADKKRPQRSKRVYRKQARRQSRQKVHSQPRERVHDIAMHWPIERSHFWLSSPFGPRKKPNGAWGFHHGIDMAAVKGTHVKAAAGGVVVEARHSSGYGKTIVIAHTGKYRTRYAHLNSMRVSVGQKVESGQYIGNVGATGFVRSKRGGDASHLHFEVYAFGKQVNPSYFLA
ncbi:MAG: M23 family metallopeptidase [Candidatus Dependentiae bacterium]|nr:M23 family metallopeptidase [Candidatus Dependentiae bacterium]